MSVFLLKLLAMGSMFIDHLAFWLVNNNIAMRNFGRLAFFIYAFLIAESYYHLKDKPERLRSHLIKLIILCIISEPLFDFFEHIKWSDFSTQSVMPTLTLGFIALVGSGCCDKIFERNKWLNCLGKVAICSLTAVLSFFIKSDYAFCGVLLVVLFYLYLLNMDNMNFSNRLISLLAIEIVYLIIDIWSRTGFGSWQEFKDMAVLLSMWKYGAVFVMIPLVFYNRKLGYRSKTFSMLYSCFYPLQFALLLMARYIKLGF